MDDKGGMIKREFKGYDLRPVGAGVYYGVSTPYTGDPRAYAREIAEGFGPQEYAPDTQFELVEGWHHKVGRKWVRTRSVIAVWTLAELLSV